MSTLAKLSAEAPKAKKKLRLKSLMKIKKTRIRMAKFAKRKGCFVVMSNYTKCLSMDCGKVSDSLRIACPSCQGIEIAWGTLVNTGKIEKNRFKCAVQNSEFITNHELHKRLVAGDRFFECGTCNPKELKVSDFLNLDRSK